MNWCDFNFDWGLVDLRLSNADFPCLNRKLAFHLSPPHAITFTRLEPYQARLGIEMQCDPQAKASIHLISVFISLRT